MPWAHDNIRSCAPQNKPVLFTPASVGCLTNQSVISSSAILCRPIASQFIAATRLPLAIYPLGFLCRAVNFSLHYYYRHHHLLLLLSTHRPSSPVKRSCWLSHELRPSGTRLHNYQTGIQRCFHFCLSCYKRAAYKMSFTKAVNWCMTKSC